MAVIIETPGEGTGWGVSLTSSNPEPKDFYPVKSQEEAQRLKTALEKSTCPRCSSKNILAPSRSSPSYLTCDPCGFDFQWNKNDNQKPNHRIFQPLDLKQMEQAARDIMKDDGATAGMTVFCQDILDLIDMIRSSRK